LGPVGRLLSRQDLEALVLGEEIRRLLAILALTPFDRATSTI
jgi:hypothetical protein